MRSSGEGEGQPLAAPSACGPYSRLRRMPRALVATQAPIAQAAAALLKLDCALRHRALRPLRLPSLPLAGGGPGWG